MGQVIPEKPLRVVVWSTGTIGRHAIAGVDAHPDLELVGVWTSTEAKDGQGRRRAGRARPRARHQGDHRPRRADRAGAGRDRAHRDGRRPGLRVHRGPDLVRRGRDQRDQQRAGAAAVARADPAAGDDREDRRRLPARQREHARQRHRPGLRQRRAAAGDDQPQPAHRRGAGHGDLRLLDLLPAGRDERPVRLRQADGRGRDDLHAGHPLDGLGERGPPDRRRPRRHPRRAAHRGGRPAPAEWDTDQRLRRRAEGDDGRGEVRRRRQGRRRPARRARAHHPHRPRAGARVGEAARGRGRLLPDQDHRRADDERRLHPPRRARRPQRLRHDHHRPAHHQRAAGGGRRRAGHRPRRRPAAGHRPRAGERAREHPRPVRRPRHRPRSSPAPAAASAPPPRSRWPRRAPTSLISARTAEQLDEVADQVRADRPARCVVVAGRPQRPRRGRRPRADGVRRVRPARHRGQQRRRHLPARRSSTPAPVPRARRSASTSPPRTRSPGPRCR